jgi:WhiB family redox-sensing transcriptional regulator
MAKLDWSWQALAACRGLGTDWFFAPDGERQPERDARERKAKAICSACPSRTPCLEFALTAGRYGVWGGLTEEERDRERRRRQRRKAVA